MAAPPNHLSLVHIARRPFNTSYPKSPDDDDDGDDGDDDGDDDDDDDAAMTTTFVRKLFTLRASRRGRLEARACRGEAINLLS